MTGARYMDRLIFFVEGDPVPKGRGRIMSSGNKRWNVTPAKTRLYEAAVRETAELAMAVRAPRDGDIGSPQPYAGPLYARLTFHLPRPKTATRMWPFGRPDLDNLAKAVLDGLNGVVFHDDAQVCCMDLAKHYAVDRVGVQVEITEL
jgi:Holliday junction resolvase RusA-like endonuclease